MPALYVEVVTTFFFFAVPGETQSGVQSLGLTDLARIFNSVLRLTFSLPVVCNYPNKV